MMYMYMYRDRWWMYCSTCMGAPTSSVEVTNYNSCMHAWECLYLYMYQIEFVPMVCTAKVFLLFTSYMYVHVMLQLPGTVVRGDRNEYFCSTCTDLLLTTRVPCYLSSIIPLNHDLTQIWSEIHATSVCVCFPLQTSIQAPRYLSWCWLELANLPGYGPLKHQKRPLGSIKLSGGP